MRKHSSWLAFWLLFTCASVPSPEAFAAAPLAKSCSKTTSNWPPEGTWRPEKGAGNAGESPYSGFTQIWTHVYKAGGAALDEIMFQVGGAQAVSIYDSPAVPDRGGHSILAGALRGNFAAILPNLAVCVSTPGQRDVCTAICKPGHSCLAQPFGAHWYTAAESDAYTINVYDVDDPNHANKDHIHLIATSRQNPARCTSDSHCKWPVADKAAYGNDSTVEISFGSACDAEQTHVIQFVSSGLACAGNDCGAVTIAQQQLGGYGATGCGGHRDFGSWYLDAGSCTSPFLTPELFCNGASCSVPCESGEVCSNTLRGVRTVTDEPSVVLPPEGGPKSRQMQRHFVDFMMCGTDVKDVIQWTRTGIGAQPCQVPGVNPRVFSSNYQVVGSTDVQKIKDQICNVEAPSAAKQAMADPHYQAIRKYLGCSN